LEFRIELALDLIDLPQLELADHDTTPSLTRADQCRVPQLEHRTLAKGMRDDLGPPPRRAKASREQIGGAHSATERDRHAPMRNARPRRGQFPLEALHELLASELRERRAGSLVGRQRTGFDLAPALRGHLAHELADLGGEAALAPALGKESSTTRIRPGARRWR